jgi:orotate phosphoribosyltransferase
VARLPSLAQRIYEQAHLTGEFTLRSGAVSSEYFDKYLFEADPRLLGDIADALVTLIPPDVEALAGLELGGIPLAIMVSQRTGLPTVFVRKAAKEYGTRRLAEGGPVNGRRLLIIEDVVTTGGQIVASATALRTDGATINAALCVIDREAHGVETLSADGLELRSLFTMSALRAAATDRSSSLHADQIAVERSGLPST